MGEEGCPPTHLLHFMARGSARAAGASSRRRSTFWHKRSKRSTSSEIARRPPSQVLPKYGRLGLRDLHQQLAEVLALEQAKKRGRCVLQALDHVLAILDAAAAHPFAHIVQEIRLPRGEIPDDEAAQG